MDKEPINGYDPATQTMLAYDGELLPAEDALNRYRRDEQLKEKYEEAEQALSSEQFTWSDVEANL